MVWEMEELMITSIDQEGTGTGCDIDLMKKIRSIVSIPIIAHGGIGNIKHIEQVINEGKANAVAIASLIHYGTLHEKSFQDKNSGEGNRAFISNLRKFKSFGPMNFNTIKKELSGVISIRL